MDEFGPRKMDEFCNFCAFLKNTILTQKLFLKNMFFQQKFYNVSDFKTKVSQHLIF